MRRFFGAQPDGFFDEFYDFCGVFDFYRPERNPPRRFRAFFGRGRSAGVLGGAVCLTGRGRNRVAGEKEGRHCEKGRARARSTL